MTTSLTWHDVLTDEKQQPYFLNTLKTVAEEHQSGIAIYPPQKDVFNAFRFTELGDVKVVILGWDPCHSPGQAYGLAFSVRPGVAIPPSLLNTYKEPEAITPGFTCPTHGYPESWARRGVLLLSTVLTVRAGQAHLHASLGWGTFTDKVITLIDEHCKGVVFLLWGSYARKKDAITDRQRHCVLKVLHPSPLSAHRGSFGSDHFVQTNQWLADCSEAPIDWTPVLPAESERSTAIKKASISWLFHIQAGELRLVLTPPFC